MYLPNSLSTNLVLTGFQIRVPSFNASSSETVRVMRRLSPLVDNDDAKIRLLNAMLLSLPGSPVLYYGDEIGMGDDPWLPDRDGVRTPMQWDDSETAGFSTALPEDFHLSSAPLATIQSTSMSPARWTTRPPCWCGRVPCSVSAATTPSLGPASSPI